MLQVLLLFVFLAFGLLTYLLLAPSADQLAILRRTEEIRRKSAAPDKLEEQELAVPFARRVLAPMFDKVYGMILRWTPGQMKDKIRSRLLVAGRPLEAARFVGWKVILALCLLVASSTLLVANASEQAGGAILLMAASVTLGLQLPEFWLSGVIARRKKALAKALPDVLDVLSVSVEAGLGFDGAVQKVSEKFSEPTSEEFSSFLKEVRLGKPRADALRNLAQRTGLPEMQTFTAAIIQADQLGVSLSKILRIQSEQMRVKRRQKAEERAMQTPIKLLFPLILFIFPTLFIVILGPLVISFLTTFSRP